MSPGGKWISIRRQLVKRRGDVADLRTLDHTKTVLTETTETHGRIIVCDT